MNKAFDAALKTFDRIDVVVNNAGYGLSGEFESVSEAQSRKQMEVNFFGLLKCTRRAMKIMREHNKPSGGLIQQVTSIGGQRGVPLFSIYCASKWAVEGFTEAISKEVKPEWGIKFTCIEPGGFRTDWAGRSMEFGEQKEKAYDHLNAQETMGKRHGTQAGDPPKVCSSKQSVVAHRGLTLFAGCESHVGARKDGRPTTSLCSGKRCLGGDQQQDQGVRRIVPEVREDCL